MLSGRAPSGCDKILRSSSIFSTDISYLAALVAIDKGNAFRRSIRAARDSCSFIQYGAFKASAAITRVYAVQGIAARHAKKTSGVLQLLVQKGL